MIICYINKLLPKYEYCLFFTIINHNDEVKITNISWQKTKNYYKQKTPLLQLNKLLAIITINIMHSLNTNKTKQQQKKIFQVHFVLIFDNKFEISSTHLYTI